MVLLPRALESFYRLSIVTMSLSAAVWSQFATSIWSKCEVPELIVILHDI